MAQLPLGTKLLRDGFREASDPSVVRTEMERGVPTERVMNTRIMATMTATLFFNDEDAIDEFETWYEDTIKRIGWFDVRHPRTKQIVSARFVGGAIGELEALGGGYASGAIRSGVKLEYLK